MGRTKGVPNKIPGMTPEQRAVRQLENARRRRAANPEPSRAWYRAYRKKHPEKMRIFGRKAALKRRYKISVADVDRMVEEQAGKCKICGKECKLHVDHNHTTGRVRAMLCLQCNVKLHTLENIEFRTVAEAYLAEYLG